MKHGYLTRRMAAAGIAFEKSTTHPTAFYASTSTHTISWFASDHDSHVTPYVKRHGQEDDIQTDYFAGSFCDSWDDVVVRACEGDPRHVDTYVAIMERRRARWSARAARRGWTQDDSYYAHRIAEAKALGASLLAGTAAS